MARQKAGIIGFAYFVVCSTVLSADEKSVEKQSTALFTHISCWQSVKPGFGGRNERLAADLDAA